MKVLIVGKGTVGGLLTSSLAGHHHVSNVSARAVLSRALPEQAFDVVVFAHGRSVNVTEFESQFDEILHSRTRVLEILATSSFCAASEPYFIMLSSTVAYQGKGDLPKDLFSLQTRYEAFFRETFGSEGCVLRLGTLVGDGSQVTEGVKALRRSIIVKRLRLAGPPTNIPWVTPKTACEAVAKAIANRCQGVHPVAESNGLDINAYFDSILCASGRLYISRRLFLWIWQRLGVRPEFFLADLDRMRAALAKLN